MENEESRTDTQVRIRKAGYDDIDAMKRVLARAYDKDPLVNWFVLQDGKRTQRIEKFFEVPFKYYAMKYDHVITTEELNGAAAWYPPEPKDCWKSSTLKNLSLIHKIISICGIRAVPSRMLGLLMMEKHHLKKPHYYLFGLGVDPSQQGKGIGSHLLQFGLSMCNEKGVPAYLETETEDNVRFYEKHDFKVVDEFLIPHNGPKIWTMIYEPWTSQHLD